MKLNQWQSADDSLIKELPYHIADWLLEYGSLTEKLSNISQTPVELEVLQQSMSPISQVEQMAISNKESKALVREVVLSANSNPWIFARTIVNTESSNLIEKLGKKPLGSILFSGEQLRRQFLEVIMLDKEHDYYQKAEGYSLASNDEYLWARRSLWSNELDGKTASMLVNEIFLQDSPLYKK